MLHYVMIGSKRMSMKEVVGKNRSGLRNTIINYIISKEAFK